MRTLIGSTNLHRARKLNFEPVGAKNVLVDLDETCAKGGTIDLATEVATCKRKEFDYTCAEGSE